MSKLPENIQVYDEHVAILIKSNITISSNGNRLRIKLCSSVCFFFLLLLLLIALENILLKLNIILWSRCNLLVLHKPKTCLSFEQLIVKWWTTMATEKQNEKQKKTSWSTQIRNKLSTLAICLKLMSAI